MSRNSLICPPQLVLHNSSLHEPRDYNKHEERLQLLTHICAARCDELYRQIEWRTTILQEMPSAETGSSSSLLYLPKMCFEDGSPLPVAGVMRWTSELQSISLVFNIHDSLLLCLLRRVSNLGMEGNIKRWRVYRELDADQLCDAGCHIRHYWVSLGRIYGMAHFACVKRPDHYRVLGKDEISEPAEKIDATSAYHPT